MEHRRSIPLLATLTLGLLGFASVASAEVPVLGAASAIASVPRRPRAAVTAELPISGPGYHWESNRGHRRSHYGLQELVASVRRAAAAVAARHPDSHVGVLDLSLPGGGHLEGHLSHTRGRDVDVEFYALGAHGRPARLPRPLAFDRTGTAVDRETGERYTLDRERTWEFMTTVLTDRSIVVERIFIAPTLRRLLLEYARATGAPASLVRHAAAVMRAAGPRSPDPHEDHFHVRIVHPATTVTAGRR